MSLKIEIPALTLATYDEIQSLTRFVTEFESKFSMKFICKDEVKKIKEICEIMELRYKCHIHDVIRKEVEEKLSNRKPIIKET